MTTEKVASIFFKIYLQAAMNIQDHHHKQKKVMLANINVTDNICIILLLAV